jgi:predicted alpha/beta-hydrolase family hydrolase
MPEPIRIPIDGNDPVSGLFDSPASPQACYVFGHGAGAGMEHPFMARVALGLSERGIATLRYQFPYMEQGSKRPDTPKVAQATVRAASARRSAARPSCR